MQKRHESRILWGSVKHRRTVPTEHSFAYLMAFFSLDIDSLDDLELSERMFGHNRWGFYSIYDEDYLSGQGSLREKVERILANQGASRAPNQILLLTMPRLCGYVFNPVSFFVCFDSDGHVMAMLTQVNNTFGETNIYPLISEPRGLPVSWKFSKKFFVSPFFDSDGEYEVTLHDIGCGVRIDVDLYREGERVFESTLQGEGVVLDSGVIFKTALKYSFSQVLTMTRIHIQALFLYFRVGVCPFQKPRPTDVDTIRSQQNWIHNVRLRLLAYLKRVKEKKTELTKRGL